jgi:murein DD-endopeptidase MepM/ murein hydrolase activator NlpD
MSLPRYEITKKFTRMNLKFLFICAFLFSFSGFLYAQKGNDSIPVSEDLIEENLDEDNVNDSTIQETIVMAFDSSSIPASKIYSLWSNTTVNPYNINLARKPDTTLINLNGYVHPVPGRITSNFGSRRYRWHYGTDLKLQIGDSVRCAFNGMIRIAKRSHTFGNYVVIRHDNGLETIYGHLSKILVNINQRIKAGDILGLGGNTGRSTGPHLHFEVRYLGNSINPIDIINVEEGRVKTDSLLLCQKHFEYLTEVRKVRYYVVRRGDTLGKIARKNGVPVTQICRLNNLKRKSVLKVGRRIRFT